MTPGANGGAAISLSALRELWLHTGTACNLSCPFCHEGSKPGDGRIGAVTFDELRPMLDAAAAAGVERFAFTGGEPLILKDIVRILQYALQLKPCLVLTNGTAPLIRRPQHLLQLKAQPHPLAFRVSIDYPDEVRHDAGRGYRNFRKALQGLKLLADAGFEVGITRMREESEDSAAIAARFRNLLRRQQLPEDLAIVALPDLGPPLQLAAAAGATDERLFETACSRSRMLIRRETGLQFCACPLVDDEPAFDLGSDLRAAMAAGVVPSHPRCGRCLYQGVDYVGSGAKSAPQGPQLGSP